MLRFTFFKFPLYKTIGERRRRFIRSGAGLRALRGPQLALDDIHTFALKRTQEKVREQAQV